MISCNGVSRSIGALKWLRGIVSLSLISVLVRLYGMVGSSFISMRPPFIYEAVSAPHKYMNDKRVPQVHE